MKVILFPAQVRAASVVFPLRHLKKQEREAESLATVTGFPAAANTAVGSPEAVGRLTRKFFGSPVKTGKPKKVMVQKILNQTVMISFSFFSSRASSCFENFSSSF